MRWTSLFRFKLAAAEKAPAPESNKWRFWHRRSTANCVVVPKTRRFRPSKAFVIVIVLAVLAAVGLSFAGVEPTVSVQVVAAVLAGIETIRRLTAHAPVALPGTAR
ncbi:hypothetical protein ACFVZR_39455 [Streptomyces sp. NPDC058316]|uniref:hypothetical protein n=1 Tax=Streptomyces sp. NPDC058316 TaxID=3346442 RepID=UPI0036E4CF07